MDKDEIDGKTLIINSSKIEQNYLINNFITEFNEDFTKSRNIKSDKIDISKKEWLILMQAYILIINIPIKVY